MALIDLKAADQMSVKRNLDIVSALSDPETKKALDTLIAKGIEPSIAHGCLMHLRRNEAI